MWGQIKRRCLKDHTITWPYATAAKYWRCSRTQVPKIMNKLMKLVLSPVPKRVSEVLILAGQQSIGVRYEPNIFHKIVDLILTQVLGLSLIMRFKSRGSYDFLK